MKRLFKTLTIAAAVLLVPYGITLGQEKQTEKKIKIVVTDNKSEKTVLDTVIIGDSQVKTINTKDGKVIFIGSSAEALIHSSDGEKGAVYVTISTDENKNVVISAADTATSTASLRVHTSTESKDVNYNATKAVVARDGVVITVEGEDEEYVKAVLEIINTGLNKRKEEQAAKSQAKKK